ncbi:MAG: hypothetical protein KDB82_09515 [Planctomycetes bacterium]|nr:hypothetical protein [Planctomycetota bacterium]
MEDEPATEPEQPKDEPEPEKPAFVPLHERIALGFLRFFCFVGVGTMLFALRTPFGAMVFITFWLALDRRLPAWLRRIGMVLTLLLVPFLIYVLRWDNTINFAVVRIENYAPDSIQPAGSTKVKVHVYPLFLHEGMHDGGIEVKSIGGPHEIWLELTDNVTGDLEISDAEIVAGDTHRAIEFERATPPETVEGWSPYRPPMKPGENTTFWRQTKPVDLARLGPDLKLKFKLWQGDKAVELETTLTRNDAVDSGLISPEAWRQ